VRDNYSGLKNNLKPDTKNKMRFVQLVLRGVNGRNRGEKESLASVRNGVTAMTARGELSKRRTAGPQEVVAWDGGEKEKQIGSSL